MSGRRLVRVEVAGDLAQALALRALCLNVKHELVRNGGRPSRSRALLAELEQMPGAHESPYYEPALAETEALLERSAAAPAA